jgi:hypothetical protein
MVFVALPQTATSFIKNRRIVFVCMRFLMYLQYTRTFTERVNMTKISRVDQILFWLLLAVLLPEPFAMLFSLPKIKYLSVYCLFLRFAPLWWWDSYTCWECSVVYCIALVHNIFFHWNWWLSLVLLFACMCNKRICICWKPCSTVLHLAALYVLCFHASMALLFLPNHSTHDWHVKVLLAV